MRRTAPGRRGSLLLVPVLALGLLAAGCGDDGGPTTDPPDSGTTAVTTPDAPTETLQQPTEATVPEVSSAEQTASEPPATADEEPSVPTDAPATETASTDAPPEDTSAAGTGGDVLTEAVEVAPIMLTAEDLPTGYGEKPYETDAEDCVGPQLDPAAAQIYGPNAFEASSVVGEARSRAWQFASPEEARAAFETATGDELQACVIRGAEEGLQGDEYEPGGTAEAQALELDPLDGADEQAATTYAATFRPKGETDELTAYSNLIFVLAGDTVAAYQFLTLQRPFSPADQQQAVAAAVARHGASA
jgi:hypothetical protein